MQQLPMTGTDEGPDNGTLDMTRRIRSKTTRKLFQWRRVGKRVWKAKGYTIFHDVSRGEAGFTLFQGDAPLTQCPETYEFCSTLAEKLFLEENRPPPEDPTKIESPAQPPKDDWDDLLTQCADVEYSYILEADRLTRDPTTCGKGLDIIYDQVDELLRKKKFSVVDGQLVYVSVRSCTKDTVLGFLTATLPAKSRLSQRVLLLDKARTMFTADELKGL